MRSSVSAFALPFLALALLLLPLQWVLAAVIAAAFHEGCHYLAVRLCGGQISFIYGGLSGAKMTAQGLLPWQELLCSLAGPLGSLMLLFLARWFPRTALCGGLQGLYNLLPLYQLDGGRALRCATQLLLPPVLAERICNTAQWLCLLGFACLAFYGFFALKLGSLPLLAVGLIIIRGFQGKTPCKPPLNSVQ